MARNPKRLAVEAILRAASDYVPDAIETPIRRALGVDVSRPKAKSLAVPRPAPRPKALPAPPKQLALPAPGPGLPSFAVKPRGGQWWSDRLYLDAKNRSPEYAARSTAEDLGSMTQVNPELPGPPPAQQWLERALTKYYKNEFGTPEDPLRDLAARGLHYDPDMTPEDWQQTANDYLLQRDIGHFTVPNTTDAFATDVRMTMPWLSKQPVTDKIYGIVGTGPYLGHFNDEFANALMRPEASGLPLDLAVRPESLARMTFPQAVEHVGKINQFRAKEMLRAGASTLNNPAVQTFKEYADDNPMGLRWTELKAPDELPEGYSVRQGEGAPREGYFGAYGPDGQPIAWGPTEEEARRMAIRAPLQDALKYEGDTMGHCVGGYCGDVMEGRSRIFSLRDAKGEPHVTIETSPGQRPRSLPKDVDAQFVAQAEAYANEAAKSGRETREGAFDMFYNRLASEWKANQPRPADDIIQIKGKQNRAPKDDYLPFVRDFVQSGNWGQIGDEENSGLRRLGGNLIPSDEYDKTLSDAYNWMRDSPGGQAVRKFYKTEMGGYGTDAYKEADKFINKLDIPVGTNSYSLNDILGVLGDPGGWDPENIESALQAVEYLKANPVELPSVFNGFAVGGRVDADRYSNYNPLTVKRGR